MSVKIITVPFDPEREVFEDETLTLFLANKRVRSLQPQFFQNRGRPYWTVFIEYEPVLSTAENLPAKEVLNDTQQALFRKLREWRKEKADQDGVPVFILATNAQLEQIVIRMPTSLEAIRQIQGFGKKKVEQHGRDILALVQPFTVKNTNDPPVKLDIPPVAESTASEANPEP